MRRREVLAGVMTVLPLAGYASTQAISPLGANDDSMNHEALRTVADIPLRGERNGIKVEVTSELTELDAAFTVGVVRGATDDHPAQVGGAFENTSDRKQKFAFGSEAPLSPMPNSSPDPMVHLRTPPADGWDKRGDCWRSESRGWLSNAVVAELKSGETISNSLDVLAAPDANGCLPVGTYEFEQSVGLFNANASGKLRFSLTLS